MSSRSIVRIPFLTAFLTMIGLIPENRKIGARMTKMSPRAKQKPCKIFSEASLYLNSGRDFRYSACTELKYKVL